MSCGHTKVVCVNQYELIRKYRCLGCGGVMMCACDQEIGEKYLPHQLRYGSEYETRRQVPVTLGFLAGVCQECRGLPADNFPVAPIYGRTSKITRYYWREIAFATMRRLDERVGDRDGKWSKAERETIERAVVEEIKVRHAKRPKYAYLEQSQESVIKATNTEIIVVPAKHIAQPNAGVMIESTAGLVSPESFAEQYFYDRGYQCIHCESRPFHALFAIYMFLLIQDPEDPLNRTVGFGSRTAFDQKIKDASPIWTLLPQDFGTAGYFRRRRKAIGRHLATIDDTDWLFDYWAGTSDHLREYLWAHDPAVIEKARRIRSILGLANLRKVLVYLVGDYWRNYCGWPDLLVFRQGEFFFVEVKSSKDKLSEDQKRWMLDNQKHLGFGFKILKISAQNKQARGKPSLAVESGEKVEIVFPVVSQIAKGQNH